MAKITYIEHTGTEHVVNVANGLTVMEGAQGQQYSWHRSRLWRRLRMLDLPRLR